jgi:hypothetical protein
MQVLSLAIGNAKFGWVVLYGLADATLNLKWNAQVVWSGAAKRMRPAHLICSISVRPKRNPPWRKG